MGTCSWIILRNHQTASLNHVKPYRLELATPAHGIEKVSSLSRRPVQDSLFPASKDFRADHASAPTRAANFRWRSSGVSR